MSNKPQSSCPFADRISRRAANNGGKWISVLLNGSPENLKRLSQKSLGLSPKASEKVLKAYNLHFDAKTRFFTPAGTQ
jgi:hypothetical protein